MWFFFCKPWDLYLALVGVYSVDIMSLGISEEGNLGIHHSVIALFCTFTFLFCCLIPLNPFHTQCLLNSNLLPINPIIITIILGKRGWYTDAFAHNQYVLFSFMIYHFDCVAFMLYPLTVVDTVDTFITNWIQEQSPLRYEKSLKHIERWWVIWV